jgi:2-oxoglutarate ferredoxin oxidoreductase subunit delta
MSTIVIDEEKCKGCQLCTMVCPKDLVTMADHFNIKGYHPSQLVDPEGECTGCAMCAMMCPDVAITVYRDSK